MVEGWVGSHATRVLRTEVDTQSPGQALTLLWEDDPSFVDFVFHTLPGPVDHGQHVESSVL